MGYVKMVPGHCWLLDSISLLTATGHGGFLYTGDTLPDTGYFSINVEPMPPTIYIGNAQKW